MDRIKRERFLAALEKAAEKPDVRVVTKMQPYKVTTVRRISFVSRKKARVISLFKKN